MYTDEEKKRIAGMVEAFKGCRKYLRADGTGICWALVTYASTGDEAADIAAHNARRLVRRALGVYPWLDDWLRSRNLRYFSFTETMALRNLWLDQLIADCEAALKD